MRLTAWCARDTARLVNPIHDAGFASLFVLAFGAAPAFFVALIAALAGRRKPALAAACAAIAAVVSTLLLVFAGLMTSWFHARIDHWIDIGAYGPPADVMRTYGPEWHASARWTARAGMVVAAVPLLLATFGYHAARAGKEWQSGALVTAGIVGLAGLYCLVMAFA
jgi:hypothetical protein